MASYHISYDINQHHSYQNIHFYKNSPVYSVFRIFVLFLRMHMKVPHYIKNNFKKKVLEQ